MTMHSGPAGCLSNQQTVNDTDLPCLGPHSPDLGSVWKWEGALVGRARQACGGTTLMTTVLYSRLMIGGGERPRGMHREKVSV